MSRTENTLRNFSSAAIVHVIGSLLSVISRLAFVKVLGENYLGLSGVAGNLISMLSLAELGIGSAITFSLYKPLAEHDVERLKTIMHFYKRAYRLIALTVFTFGIALLPLLNVLIKDGKQIEHLHFVFFLHVVNASSSYLITYKSTLLTADQKNYCLFKINTAFSFASIAAQIGMLFISRSYTVYLVTQIFMTFIQRVVINRFVTREYPFLNEPCNAKLPAEDKKVIGKNIRALIVHKIGDYFVNSTDNLIISACLSLAISGYYSNYLLIFTTINGIIVMLFNSMTASYGNLLASNETSRQYQIYREANFLAFWLYGFSAICFFYLCNPFLTLVFGKNFTFEWPIVLLLIINNYMTGMRVPVFTVKSAAGIFSEDRFVPLVQSAVNLGVSIIAANYIGLAGVFLGTFVSALLPSFYRPYLVYKRVFQKSYIYYLKDYFLQMLTVTVAGLITGCGVYVVNLFFHGVFGFAINMLVCAVVPNIVFFALYRKTSELQELVGIARRLLKRMH